MPACPPLMTDIENAVLAAESARGGAATDELAATNERLATLRADIAARTDRFGLVAVDAKEPMDRQGLAETKEQFSPEELRAAEEAVARLGAERDAAVARVLLLEMASRIQAVHAGVALCADRSGDGDIHLYAPGDAGEASKRSALVFRDDEEEPGAWVVRLRYRNTSPAERRWAPKAVECRSQEECLAYGRDWVALGKHPG